LEAERHDDLCVKSAIGLERGRSRRTEARISGDLVARDRPRCGGHDRGQRARWRAHDQPGMAHVHDRLDRPRQPAGDLLEVEQARHRAGQRLDRPYIVSALAEERAVDHPLHPFPQRVEHEHHREHEGG